MQKQGIHKPFVDSVDIIHAGHHLVPEISRDDVRGVSLNSTASRALVEKANHIYADASGDRRKLIDETLRHYNGKLGLLERARNIPARMRQLLAGYPPEWAYRLHDRLKGQDGFYEETIGDICRGYITSGFPCKFNSLVSTGGNNARKIQDDLFSFRKKGEEVSTSTMNDFLGSRSPAQKKELVGIFERKRENLARRISRLESFFPKLKGPKGG